MKKTTQKEIKHLVSIGEAKNVDDWYGYPCRHIMPITRIAFSRGKYGLNGLLFRGSDGELYAVTARNSALFYFL